VVPKASKQEVINGREEPHYMVLRSSVSAAGTTVIAAGGMQRSHGWQTMILGG